MLEADYNGLCSICGETGVFVRGDQRSLRESYACPSCRFTVRWRDQASIIVDEYGRGQANSLTQAVNRGFLDNVKIFEPALRGPFVQRMRNLPNYEQSYFWPDMELGELNAQGVRNEDLTNLTFEDDSFDLILTSDVMEHLYDIEKAFSEITRVLRPGGIHVFTIPNDYPFPAKTTKRVEMKDGKEIFIKPERYHNSGDGSKCLVYTDYGADMLEMIDQLGARTSIVRRSGAIEPCYTNATFVTRKIAGSGGRRPPRPGQASAPAVARTPDLVCPVCDGTEFEAFNGRINARCSTCRAVERNRTMWMIFDECGVFEPNQRVLHLAPEYGLAKHLHELSGDLYHPRDFDPERYKSRLFTVKKLDLCSDLFEIPDESYDLIIHSHVLEHIACDVAGTLRELDRILAPGGKHFFSVPIRGDITQEDLSDDLSDTHRLMLFGQEDHYRIFGATSLKEMLNDVWGEGNHLIEPVHLLGAERLKRAAIPREAWAGISSHSIFGYTKGAPAGFTSKAPQSAKAAEIGAGELTLKELNPSLSGENAGALRTCTFRWILGNLFKQCENVKLVDLGAGPLLFSGISQRYGFDVTAVDGRTERLPEDLNGIKFIQSDIREFDLQGFEVVLMLGLMYHLTLDDQIKFLQDFPVGASLILDTQIHFPELVVENPVSGRGGFADTVVVDQGYEGVVFPEVENPMASIGNATSFWATEPSLFKMMEDAGFTEVTTIDPPYVSTYGGRRWYVARKSG